MTGAKVNEAKRDYFLREYESALRDEFAKAALTGFASWCAQRDQFWVPLAPDKIAAFVYEIADACMAEREKKP